MRLSESLDTHTQIHTLLERHQISCTWSTLLFTSFTCLSLINWSLLTFSSSSQAMRSTSQAYHPFGTYHFILGKVRRTAAFLGVISYQKAVAASIAQPPGIPCFADASREQQWFINSAWRLCAEVTPTRGSNDIGGQQPSCWKRQYGSDFPYSCSVTDNQERQEIAWTRSDAF